MSELVTNAPLTGDATQNLEQRLEELRSGLHPEKKLNAVKLKKACQDFEAVFISQIWKQMRGSVPKDGMLHSKEEESYLSMFDQELSVKMAQGGGIGLSDLLYTSLSERLMNASRNTSSASPLQPLDKSKMAREPVAAQAMAVQASTLAAQAAQKEAEKLAERIERKHAAGGMQAGLAAAGDSMSELEEALRVVRMDVEGDL
ncbi:MAG: hypothetical protein GXY42_05100 [Desulfovibrionales bacterium]|nr:hypothetical protein [Desulfovibrionales bacterium]